MKCVKRSDTVVAIALVETRDSGGQRSQDFAIAVRRLGRRIGKIGEKDELYFGLGVAQVVFFKPFIRGTSPLVLSGEENLTDRPTVLASRQTSFE